MKPDSVRFTLSVTITQPLELEDGESADPYIDKREQRRLEKAVIQALRKLDGDADCECLEVELVDADGHGYVERDEAYERAAARARNNDFADTGGKDWT